MRTTIFGFFCALATIVTACNSKPSEFRNDFRWIAGKWQGTNGSVFMMEQSTWNKTRFEGRGFEIDQGDTLFSERLYLQSFDGAYAYIAYLPKHGLTLFNARKETETHWIFENQDHDFPAAIHYKLESDSTITVSLLAKGEPFRGEHSYQLKRIK